MEPVSATVTAVFKTCRPEHAHLFATNEAGWQDRGARTHRAARALPKPDSSMPLPWNRRCRASASWPYESGSDTSSSEMSSSAAGMEHGV